MYNYCAVLGAVVICGHIDIPAELLTSRLRPDPEVADHQRGRLLRPSDDLTSDSSLDTNSLLFGLPALGQLNNSPFNIAGGGGPNPQQALANQLRPGGPTSLQQAFGSSLGNQPSALPDFTTLLQVCNCLKWLIFSILTAFMYRLSFRM